MVEDGTDMQVLSPMPGLLSHWLPADDAEYLADVMNEQIAAMIAQSPGNFAGVGMVCAQDVPRAVRQLQKVKTLGFSAIEIGTHINGATPRCPQTSREAKASMAGYPSSTSIRTERKGMPPSGCSILKSQSSASVPAASRLKSIASGMVIRAGMARAGLNRSWSSSGSQLAP
jgi:predicted TIM-barrel fold metal-dependent hydrolase